MTSEPEQPELYNLQTNKKVLKQYAGIGVRHLQAIFLFLSLAAHFMMRMNLSMAIVVMTDTNSNNSDYVTFNWSMKERSALLSSFFFGYFFMNLMAAVMVTKYNNKVLLLISLGYSSIVTVLTPQLVGWGGFYMLLFTRISMGFVQGFMMPVTHSILSRWAPPLERGRLGSLVLGGGQLGTIVMFLTSGVLAKVSGWPSIFYLSGGLGLLFSIVLFEFGSPSPSTCSYLSSEEAIYINANLNVAETHSKRKIPWKGMLTNLPCYAVLFATLGHNWGSWTLSTQMPSFINSVLHFDISSNGIFTSLPYIAFLVCSIPASLMADFLIRKGITSLTISRKLCNSIAHWGGALSLILLGHTSNSTVAIGMYIVTIALTCFTMIGFNINHLDLCPNYAGMLMGLVNGVSNITSVLGPLFVGFVVTDSTNAEEWRIVFYVSAGVFFVGNLLFLIFGSGEEQEFNKIADEESKGQERGRQ